MFPIFTGFISRRSYNCYEQLPNGSEKFLHAILQEVKTLQEPAIFSERIIRVIIICKILAISNLSANFNRYHLFSLPTISKELSSVSDLFRNLLREHYKALPNTLRLLLQLPKSSEEVCDLTEGLNPLRSAEPAIPRACRSPFLAHVQCGIMNC